MAEDIFQTISFSNKLDSSQQNDIAGIQGEKNSKEPVSLARGAMGFEKKIGKYQLVRTIGEGSFSKVKLAVNGNNGQKVAIKVIDKHMILENNLKTQAKPHPSTFPLSTNNRLFNFLNQGYDICFRLKERSEQ